MEIYMTWWLLLGIIIGIWLRCEPKKYETEEDKFKDPWNWTGFG